MSLGGFFKNITAVARAAGNPGGSAIRAVRGQPIVGHNSFGSVADPLNAVHASQAPAAPVMGQTPYQSQFNWAAPTMSRQDMVAQALANHASQGAPAAPAAPPPMPPQVPPGAPPQFPGGGPPMMPPPGMQAPGMQPPAPRPQPMPLGPGRYAAVM